MARLIGWIAGGRTPAKLQSLADCGHEAGPKRDLAAGRCIRLTACGLITDVADTGSLFGFGRLVHGTKMGRTSFETGEYILGSLGSYVRTQVEQYDVI